MADVQLIPATDDRAWSAALSGVAHAFQHTAAYMRAVCSTSGEQGFLCVLPVGSTRLLCPLLERPFGDRLDVATPSGVAGFVGDAPWGSCAPQWRALGRARGWVSAYVGLHPLFSPCDIHRQATANGRAVYALRLGLGPDELLRRMSERRRSALRSWETRAARLVHDREAIASYLVAEYPRFMRAVGVSKPEFGADALRQLCRTDACLVVGRLGYRGQVEAAGVFGVTPHGAEWLISLRSPGVRDWVTDVVWYGATALADRGVQFLHIGGGVTDGDGIARAKRSFSPETFPLRSLRCVFMPESYAELCRRAVAGQPDTSGYFPAYRAASARARAFGPP
jgi:hypothetical protein